MARGDESLSNLRALEGKRQCFSIFYYVNMSTKSKTDGEFYSRQFPSVIFRESWQTGSKCFTLVGARFSGISKRQFFRSGKHIDSQKSKNLPLQTLLFSSLNSFPAGFEVL